MFNNDYPAAGSYPDGPPSNAPVGYRNVGGLFVPESLPKAREVWTQDEARLIDRFTKLIASRGLVWQLACPDERCQGQKLERSRSERTGEVTLSCAHKDRLFARHV